MTARPSANDIEILRYEDRYREPSMEVLRKSFFVNENVCIGTEVNRSPQAQKDLEQLCLEVAIGGVSLIARHKPTGTIVGVSFNVLQTPSGPDDSNYFEQFRDTKCTTDSSRALMQYMITMDAKVNLFERFNVTCLLEIMFLATLPAFTGCGIATQLVVQSVRLAEQLKSGEAVPLVAAGASVTSDRPQLVSALWTSRISQRVGAKAGFTVINTVPYTEFVFEGKPFTERIGPEHPFSTLVVKNI
ncbi:AGAP001449-PA-like protein [Anopheles sinensis]|uniref:AGAP001449-PA-like protein n=1 Tax=Anopheles sinensis TaxID=74873 RepID=A0A084VCZ2_ANOSI|nr:AGAP001449-PA-like protein [Anopheles sinensis]